MTADGWTAVTMARFAAALAQLAVSNDKARKLSVLLAQAGTLEEQQRTVAAWRMLAANIARDGSATAAPQDLPHWYQLAALFATWTEQEGAPAGEAPDVLSQ